MRGSGRGLGDGMGRFRVCVGLEIEESMGWLFEEEGWMGVGLWGCGSGFGFGGERRFHMCG